MIPPEVVYVPQVSPLSAAQYMSMLPPSSAQQYMPAAGGGNASPAGGMMPPNLAPLLMPGANGQPLTFEQYLAQLPMPVVAPAPSDLLQGIGSLPMTNQS
jgi:hypothetical protein